MVKPFKHRIFKEKYQKKGLMQEICDEGGTYPYVAAVATWTPGRLLIVDNFNLHPNYLHDTSTYLDSKVSPFKSFDSPGGVRANVGGLGPEEDGEWNLTF